MNRALEFAVISLRFLVTIEDGIRNIDASEEHCRAKDHFCVMVIAETCQVASALADAGLNIVSATGIIWRNGAQTNGGRRAEQRSQQQQEKIEELIQISCKLRVTKAQSCVAERYSKQEKIKLRLHFDLIIR